MDVRERRQAKEEYFRHAQDSPLTVEQRRAFGGLSYFDPDPAYRFVVSLDPAGDDLTEEVEMSDGSTNELELAGTLRFRVDATDVSLVAYRQGHDLFIPFRDATSAHETYGAGRYVEAEPIEDGGWQLDFNLAYNPYCAYNEHWRCPLPPRENWLSVPIRAGEKTFAH